MTAPVAKRTDQDEPMERELENWPGVSWKRSIRGKHYALVLTFNGATRFVTYSSTPGDRASRFNAVRDLRSTLRDLGAVRKAPAKSASPRRTRARAKRPTAQIIPMTVKADPWVKLERLKLQQPEELTKPDGIIMLPPRPGFWRRALDWLFGQRSEITR